MRIAENTAERLVVTERPWALVLGATLAAAAPLLLALTGYEMDSAGQRLLVGALGAGGLWLVWRYLPFYTLIFDRSAGHVSHHIHRVTGTLSHHIPLGEIDWAKIEVRWLDDTRGERLVLGLKDGPVPLEFGFGPAPRQPVADAINEWLTRPC